MSTSRRRERRAAPITAAGLLSFYEDYESRIKVGPSVVVGVAIMLAALVAAAHIFLPALP